MYFGCKMEEVYIFSKECDCLLCKLYFFFVFLLERDICLLIFKWILNMLLYMVFLLMICFFFGLFKSFLNGVIIVILYVYLYILVIMVLGLCLNSIDFFMIVEVELGGWMIWRFGKWDIIVFLIMVFFENFFIKSRILILEILVFFNKCWICFIIFEVDLLNNFLKVWGEICNLFLFNVIFLLNLVFKIFWILWLLFWFL